jgi:hypothetical protein
LRLITLLWRVVIPGLGYRLVGRFAQMPLLQPLMRWLTRVSRLLPTPAAFIDDVPTAPANAGVPAAGR